MKTHYASIVTQWHKQLLQQRTLCDPIAFRPVPRYSYNTTCSRPSSTRKYYSKSDVPHTVPNYNSNARIDTHHAEHIRAILFALHADINPVDRTLWAGSEPLAWANESFRIVEDYVYENLEGPQRTRLGAGYEQENRRTVERQLKKAGVRLGALLNALLTAP